MKENVPVNFDTYYFWELLNEIENRGSEKYNAEEFRYLKRFLDALRKDEDAFQNITRLAGSSTTSDFAIFFSDILERVRSLDPTDAFKKIEEYARDFLETFGLLIEEAGWKKALGEEIGEEAPAEETPAEETPSETLAAVEESLAATPSEPDVSYPEFVQRLVQQRVEQQTLTEDVPTQAAILEFFQKMMRDAELADRLVEADLNEEIPQWLDVLAAVTDTHPEIPFDKNWLATLNEKIGQLVEQGIRLFNAHRPAIEAILSGKPASAEQPTETASEEPTLEAAFDAIEFSEEEPAETPESKELEELVEKAEALEKQKKPVPGEMSEEELKRRRLLRDYVVGEVDGFREEVVHLIERLIQDPGQEKLRKYLVDSIKSLKDLGKIHNYPAIELIANRLADILQSGQEFKQSILADLDRLFQLMREYVDANLNDADAPVMNEITKALESLQEHAEPAGKALSAADEASVRKAFFEIVRRYLGRMTAILDNAAALDDPETRQRMEKIVQNLVYWAQSLNMEAPRQFFTRISEWLPEREDVVPAIRQLLQDLTNRPDLEQEAVWEAALQELSGLSETEATEESAAPEEPEVPVEAAGEAVNTVAERLLQEVRRALDTTDDLIPFVEKTLLPAFVTLKENFELAGYDRAAWIADTLYNKILDYLSAVAPEKPALAELLDYLTEHAPQLPEGWSEEVVNEKLSAAFPVETLTTQVETETTTESEEPSEVTEAIDIDAVFQKEALKYCEKLEELLTQLRQSPENTALWQEFTVEAHTLKGSSQMLRKDALAAVATGLEDIGEAVEKGQLKPSEMVLAFLEDSLAAIRQLIEGQTVDTAPFVSRAEEILQAPTVEAEEAQEAAEEVPEGEAPPQEETPEPQPEPEQPVIEEEAPAAQRDEETYLYLKEQDPELLSIFQDEAVENLELIQSTVANLEKFTFDKKAIQDVEQAVHEIHTSAKLLGFKEIGRVAEVLEKLVEKISSRQLENWRDALRFIRRGGVVIQELMKSGKVDRREYHTILQEVEQIVESGFVPGEAGEEVPPEPVTPPVETPAEPSAPEESVPAAEEVKPESEVSAEKIQQQVIDLFLQEATEKLEEINFALISLEKEPANAELHQHLMRSFHTLKGSAGLIHATHIEHLTHLSEDIIEHYRQQNEPLPADFIDLLFNVADEINYITQALQQFQEERTSKYDELASQLEDYARNIGLAAPAPSPAETPVEEPAAASEKTAEPAEEELVTEVKEEVTPRREEAFVRLNMSKMDFLLNNSAELVVGHTQFKNLLEKFRNTLPGMDTDVKTLQEMVEHINTIVQDQQAIQEKLNQQSDLEPGTLEAVNRQLENLQKLQKNLQAIHAEIQQQATSLRDFARASEDSLQKLSKTSNTLLDYIMQARLVPIGLLFRRFQRPIRDMARQANKKIKLQITGEETELDRALVDRLYEPLLHIIRNAIDHGLEPPEERRRNGKEEEGLLKIKAWRNRNQVVVEVSDDGRGIDVEKVRQRAIEMGLISTHSAENMTHEEILQLIFSPGFSTTTETTLMSGRGVGLDAVKSTIERLRGDVRVSSEPGEGTIFSIRIPISLSVIQSMLVDVNGQVYSIPLLEVEETIHLLGSEFLKKDGEYFYNYQNETIPVLYAPHILRVKGQEPPEISPGEEYPGIILQHEGRRVMLVVDRIIRREEILIKSIGRSLQHLKYIAGGAIMEDGHVVLVLDVAQIVQDYFIRKSSGDGTPRPRRRATDKRTEPPKKRQVKVVGRPPVLLIVDDSVSIRKYVSGLFLEQGFKTETAANGREALEKLRKNKIDLVITDLEMPHYNGYELIEAIRKDDNYQELPIVVLTGRTGHKFEEMSHSLGADAYINKPFRDQELINKVKEFIIQA